jgi:hypothetical protein
MVAALGFLKALGEAAVDCDDAGRLAALGRQIDQLEELAREALAGFKGFNRDAVTKRAAQLRHAMAEPGYERRLRDGAAWLGGAS